MLGCTNEPRTWTIPVVQVNLFWRDKSNEGNNILAVSKSSRLRHWQQYKKSRYTNSGVQKSDYSFTNVKLSTLEQNNWKKECACASYPSVKKSYNGSKLIAFLRLLEIFRLRVLDVFLLDFLRLAIIVCKFYTLCGA